MRAPSSTTRWPSGKSLELRGVRTLIASRAAALTTANIAHVIFLTNDVSYPKSLSKALPNTVFRQISLSDCSPEVAKRFVLNQLNTPDADEDEDAREDPKPTRPHQRRDLTELDSCIDTLGGRLTDLEFLARRIKAGESPRGAVREIVQQSASEILKMFIFGAADDASARRWTPEQAWVLITRLAAHPDLRYHELLLDGAFADGGEGVIRALEEAELIAVATSHGRPYAIRPGRPVYQSAFRMLTEDRVLKSRLDLAILTEAMKAEAASIDKYERELKLLGELPKQTSEIGLRVNYLLEKLRSSQMKIQKMDAESGKLKKVLQEEY